jgi:hypothetical protein
MAELAAQVVAAVKMSVAAMEEAAARREAAAAGFALALAARPWEVPSQASQRAASADRKV